MNHRLLFAILCCALFFSPDRGAADNRIDGYFIAGDRCRALSSIRNNTNPGNVRLTVDRAYEVIAKNRTDATHYRIRIKNASPSERWVPAACGKLLSDCREQTSGNPPLPATGPDYVLALSWQAAFCQSHQQTAECRSQTAERPDAMQFSLHGLWPQPQSNVYCGVPEAVRQQDSRRLWEQLPDFDLSQGIFTRLAETMPGVASFLHRHEWTKHGTCYAATAEEYFRESILLTDQVNASGVRELFAANIGQTIAASDIKARFDAAFGTGAGTKVRVECDGGLVSELRISLRGNIDGDTRLSELLQNAEPPSSSCQNGRIDRVGF
ncbi:MAG: hypothetical protein L0Y38_01185 [Methylococcaceae bacterium]|nr:hypothetical protein [Methylococcaceae bacterium]MCI0732419.1 hypothetical protein [Methylococcaceae bacterium]